MSLMSDLGTAVGLEFKNQRDLIKNLETNTYNKLEIDQTMSLKLDISSFNGTEILNKLKIVAGTNSGLDADLLDGHEGSYYQPATNAITTENIGTQNVASALKLTNASRINGILFDGSKDITINAVDSTSRIARTEKGVANGVATLDANGVVYSTQLPSYVDDVLEYDDISLFPENGERSKIYVAKDNNKTYRWSGSTYVYITSGAVDSVNGQTGIVDIVDIVGNSATTDKLQKGITINGVYFDGTQDIVVVDTTKQDTLISETNIKSIVGKSLLGSGSIDLYITDLFDAKTDTTSIFLGTDTGNNDMGNTYSTVLGVGALKSNFEGIDNIAIGNDALMNTSGSKNIGIGNKAGLNLLTGNNNIYIGNNVDVSEAVVENEIVIGNSINGQGNNTVTLGNDNSTDLYMGSSKVYTKTGDGSQFLSDDGTYKFISRLLPFDVAQFINGKLYSSETVIKVIAPRTITIPANMVGSYAHADTAPSTTLVMTIYKNGVSQGNITFNATKKEGIITSSEIILSAGDILTVVAPISIDATFSNFACIITGSMNY